jgi:hypothetical protein
MSFRSIVLILMLFGQAALADGVPRCWTADQPGAQIQDGFFRVFIPTGDHSARDVAAALVIASYSLAEKTAVGAADDLERIEIDLVGDTKYWRPTAAYPTLEAFKDAIIATIEPLLKIQGVSVECAALTHHHPAP